MSIDWEEEVKEFQVFYDDDEGIHEYIESLLPQYYGDIYQTYHDVIGTYYNKQITHAHVGMTIDKILLWDIYIEYSNAFWAEYKLSNDEEE